MDYKKPTEIYNLETVLLHRGRAGAGHYFTLCNDANDEWLLLNDDRVGDFDESKVHFPPILPSFLHSFAN